MSGAMSGRAASDGGSWNTRFLRGFLDKTAIIWDCHGLPVNHLMYHRDGFGLVTFIFSWWLDVVPERSCCAKFRATEAGTCTGGSWRRDHFGAALSDLDISLQVHRSNIR